MFNRENFLVTLFFIGLVGLFIYFTNYSNNMLEPSATLVEENQAVTETTYPPTSVSMELVQVSQHAYYAQGEAGMATDNEGFISNAGVVITNDGVVIFDALGTPSLAAKMVSLIRNITDQPIKKVVVSHYHADHIYGLQVFDALGAEIIAPYGAQKYVNAPIAEERLEERRFSLDPWVNENTHIVLPDITVDKGITFQLGGIDFVVNYLGSAHSDGDLAMYIKQDKVLFSGDIIFEGRIPFIGNGDTRHWLETLEEMETSGLSVLVPGHGPHSNSPGDTISLTRRYLAFMREKMGSAVEDLKSFDEVYAETDWSEFENLPAFEAGNRVNAYQVFLSMEAELFK